MPQRVVQPHFAGSTYITSVRLACAGSLAASSICPPAGVPGAHRSSAYRQFTDLSRHRGVGARLHSSVFTIEAAASLITARLDTGCIHFIAEPGCPVSSSCLARYCRVGQADHLPYPGNPF